MNKDPINVYWSPRTEQLNNTPDWSSFYPKPKSLFSDVRSHKTDTAPSDSLLACPAVSNKFKKTIVFESPMNCLYEYDFTDGKKDIAPKSSSYLGYNALREPSLDLGPNIDFGLYYSFFSDEPLNAYFTPPFFHKSKYTNYGSIIPGEFDIGQWFRGYSFELQMWNQKGEFKLEEEEPLFYVEFKTDRPIHIRRFNTSSLLLNYTIENALSTQIFGRGQSLLTRYNRFNKVGMREKILTEIKKNLIEEEPFIL
jgi:hypothetical protein